LKEVIDKHVDHLLLDVRSDVEYSICSLPNSLRKCICWFLPSPLTYP